MANEVKIQNLAAFEAAVKEAAEQLDEEQLPIFFKVVVLNALRGYVLGTRVDTGRARGGWQVSINKVLRSGGLRNFLLGARKDKAGSKTLAEGNDKLNKITPLDTIYVQNNVNYIGFLEELDHMVENTNRRIKNKIEAGSL